MKTFNIWRYDARVTGPTGPWFFVLEVRASSEAEAIDCAKMRFGLDGKYKAYEGI
jgi:hypothetical protein